MNTKSILKSKTFWLNVIAFILALFPACKTWIAANPESTVAVLTALNVIVRFVTSGRISIFADGGNMAGSGGVPLWLFGVATAGLCMGLPSCSPETRALLKEYPIKGCYIKDGIRVCASTKSGLEFEVDQSTEVDQTSRK
jgi:hypothetical protein